MAMIVALILSASACGVGKARVEQASTVRKMPESTLFVEGKPLSGSYVTDEFHPAFSFRVGDVGWRTWAEEGRHGGRGLPPGETAEMSDYLGILYAPKGDLSGTLDFMHSHWVFEVIGSYKIKTVQERPEDMVAWLQKNPYLHTEKPEPTRVRGERGVQFDAVVSRLPQDRYPCGIHLCVPLFRNAANPGSYYALAETEKARFIVLDDVKGETVTIAITAPNEKFDEFVPEAEKVLATLDWEQR